MGIPKPSVFQAAEVPHAVSMVSVCVADLGMGPRPINARAEGIEAKPTFCGTFRHDRCLIPASGFHEWQTVGGRRKPFYTRPCGDEGIFVFAGLLSVRAGSEAEQPTCTIVTTKPNEVMAPLHDQMLVILAPQEQEAWLDPENRHAAELLHPFDPGKLEAYAVGSAVGNPRNERTSQILAIGD